MHRNFENAKSLNVNSLNSSIKSIFNFQSTSISTKIKTQIKTTIITTMTYIKVKNYCYECNAYELKISSYENYAKIFTMCDVKLRMLINS